MVTEGMKTSEFYVTVIVTVAAFYAAFNDIDAGTIAACLTSSGIYIGGRSYTKKGK